MKKIIIVILMSILLLPPLFTQEAEKSAGKQGKPESSPSDTADRVESSRDDEDFSELFSEFEKEKSTKEKTKADNSKEKPTSAELPLKRGLRARFFGEHSPLFYIPLTKTGNKFDFNTSFKRPRLQNTAGVDIRFKELDLKSSWDLDLLLLEKEGTIDINSQGNYGENFLAWNPWKLRIAAGFQEYTWGRADEWNPTDKINSLDFSQNLFGKKKPLFSLSADFYPAEFMSIQAIYAPFKSTHKLSENPQEFIPSQLFYGLNLTNNPENPVNPLPVPQENPKDIILEQQGLDPANFLAGTKFDFYLRYLDFSFSYLIERDPCLSPNVEMEADNILLDGTDTGSDYYRLKQLKLKRNLVQHIGTDIKTTAGPFTFWLEAALELTEDLDNTEDKIRNHLLEWTAGLDFNFGPENRFYSNIQYFGEWTPGYDDNYFDDYDGGMPAQDKTGNQDYMRSYYYRSLSNSLALRDAGMKHGLLLNMEFPLFENDLLLPRFFAAYLLPFFYNTEDNTVKLGSAFLNPELEIKPLDNFYIRVGGMLPYAWQKNGSKISRDESSDFGAFYDQANAYIQVEYKWKLDFER